MLGHRGKEQGDQLASNGDVTGDSKASPNHWWRSKEEQRREKQCRLADKREEAA
ncbi:MAG TPA: hypothetical protein VF635_16300 [Propionibacteriaceae bacterium]